MNNFLINKILSKLTLKELYTEISDNDEILCTLGMILASKKKAVFASLIKKLIEETIDDERTDLYQFLKTQIITMGSDQIIESVPINKVLKQKVIKSAPQVDDLCSHSVVGRRTTLC